MPALMLCLRSCFAYAHLCLLPRFFRGSSRRLQGERDTQSARSVVAAFGIWAVLLFRMTKLKRLKRCNFYKFWGEVLAFLIS